MRSVAWVLGGIVAAGLLTGCGGTWQKAGAGAAEFDRDWAYCLASTPHVPNPPRPASMSLPVSPLSAEAANETRYREVRPREMRRAS